MNNLKILHWPAKFNVLFFSICYTWSFVSGQVFTKKTTHDKDVSFLSPHPIVKIVSFILLILALFVSAHLIYRYSMLLFWNGRNHLAKTGMLFQGGDNTESEVTSQEALQGGVLWDNDLIPFKDLSVVLF